MIRALVFASAIVFATAGLNVYLQPNDFSNCENSTSICGEADAVVAISGGDTDARADAAIDLYKNNMAKKIVFSGAAKDKSGPSNAAVMKNSAIEAGVPATDIYIDEAAESTSENAINTYKILKENNFKKIILVTSGYHQRRAYLEFQRHAKTIEVQNYPVQTDNDWSPYWWLSLRGWLLAVSEVIKITVFYISGIWS